MSLTEAGEALGLVCCIFVCVIILYQYIQSLKRRDEMIKKLSKAENADFLIKDYARAKEALRHLFVSLGGKESTANHSTIVELYHRALLKRQIGEDKCRSE